MLHISFKIGFTKRKRKEPKIVSTKCFHCGREYSIAPDNLRATNLCMQCK